MRLKKGGWLTQPNNRRTGPLVIAVLILIATTVAIVDRLPAFAQEDTKAISTVRVESSQPGELEVSWDAPTDTPRDYRVNWARVGESFPTWTDLSGNSFPTSPSYTIIGVDEGVRYKVKVRARYNGSSGPWTEPVEAAVAAAEPTATHTATATDTPSPTATHTPTATDTPRPTATHTPSSAPRAVSNVAVQSNANGEATVT